MEWRPARVKVCVCVCVCVRACAWAWTWTWARMVGWVQGVVWHGARARAMGLIRADGRARVEVSGIARSVASRPAPTSPACRTMSK